MANLKITLKQLIELQKSGALLASKAQEILFSDKWEKGKFELDKSNV